MEADKTRIGEWVAVAAFFVHFQYCSFSHVLRHSNCMAHVLVAWGPFCNSLGALPISILSAHILEAERADGSGPPSFI